MRYSGLIILLISIAFTSCTQSSRFQKSQPVAKPVESEQAEIQIFKPSIKPAAERTRHYFDQLEGKRIGIVANQTSVIGEIHLVDSLLSAGFNLIKVFSPEHGFRGQAEAGEHVNDNFDARTGLPIISLYGDHRKPTSADLDSIDLLLFDLQDVGARFYTYISTLTLVMEACAENNLPLLVLDRPNPNGFYIDGPILEPAFSSFIGMHPVPIAHGMTSAEYANMVNGEGWLKSSQPCDLSWIEMSGYTHRKHYNLPVKPSPNLPDMESVYLYPSLCLFEGTIVSVGRGTDYPFSIIGYPGFTEGVYTFIPESRSGASLNPPYKGIECLGFNLRNEIPEVLKNPGISLEWLILMYKSYPQKDQFFTSFFNKLAGNSTLQQQIRSGLSEDEIKASWQQGLDDFQKIRGKYLLYHDF